jgi:hypothetical protein
MALTDNGDGTFTTDGGQVIAGSALSPEMHAQLQSSAMPPQRDLPWRPRYQDAGTITPPGEQPPPAVGLPPSIAAPAPTPPAPVPDPTPSIPPMATTLSVTKGAHLDPKDAKEMAAAHKAEIQAQVDVTRATVDAQRAQSDIYKQQLEKQQADEVAARQQEASRRSALDAKMAEINGAVDDLKSSKIDPQRVWHNMGTGQKIGMALSMALGAFGASLTHGPNFAKEMFDKKVDDDIASQKEEIAKRKDLVGLKNNQLAQLMQRGLDERQAESALRMQKLQGFDMQIKQQMAQSGTAQAKASGEQLLAKNQSDFAQQQAQLHLSTQDRVQMQMQPNTQAAEAQQKQKALEVNIGGRTLVAPDAEAAKKLRDQAAGLEEFKKKADEYKALVQESGTNLVGKKRAMLQGLQKDMQLAYLRAQGISRLNGGELEIAEKQFADATGVLTPNSRSTEMVDRVSNRLQAGFIENLKTNGMIRGQ